MTSAESESAALLSLGTVATILPSDILLMVTTTGSLGVTGSACAVAWRITGVLCLREARARCRGGGPAGVLVLVAGGGIDREAALDGGVTLEGGPQKSVLLEGLGPESILGLGLYSVVMGPVAWVLTMSTISCCGGKNVPVTLGVVELMFKSLSGAIPGDLDTGSASGWMLASLAEYSEW